MEILGIDVGGSGIKGAPVDVNTGELLRQRYRIPTPQPAKPESVSEVINKVAKYFEWSGPIGIGFPSAIRDGVALTASNIHKKWIGLNATQLISEETGCPVRVINDADAAGLAEITFGAGKGLDGVIIVVTIGTGLGTALFTDGKLLPNAELGNMKIDGVYAEWRASDAARKREKLSWNKWGKRFNIFLNELERLFWPDLFILGGGTSKKYDKFCENLDIKADVVPAELLNEAGIVGAALATKDYIERGLIVLDESKR